MSITSTYNGKTYQGQPLRYAMLHCSPLSGMQYGIAKKWLEEELDDFYDPFKTMVFAVLYTLHKRNKELEKIKTFLTEHRVMIDYLVKVAESRKEEKVEERDDHTMHNTGLGDTTRHDYPSAPNQVSINGVNYNRDGWNYDIH